MKFEFKPATTEVSQDIKDYLRETYENEEPVYYSNRDSLQKCLKQFFKLTINLSEALKYINKVDTNSLIAQTITLYQNITSHVNNIDSYPEAEQKNIYAMCGYGKKRFEQICYHLACVKQTSKNMIDIMAAFLYSEQIEECMGGVLTIIEDTYYALTVDIQALVQHVCITKIKSDAKSFIDTFDLLRLYNEGDIETSRMRHAATHTEVHFVNVMFNSVAKSTGCLPPIYDAYEFLYIKYKYWINRFANQYNNELLVDYFVQWYINNLPECAQYFNDVDYLIITNKLNLLGPDPSFALYDPNESKMPLKDNHLIILRASIIKRLLASNLLRLEHQELKCSTLIGKMQYNLYLLGEKNNCWLESFNSDGESAALSLNENLPALFHTALFSLIGSPMCLHEMLMFTACANDNVNLLKDILALGIDPNITNNSNQSLLMIATIYNCEATIKHLLNITGLKVNTTNKQDGTALILAVKKHNIVLTRLILNHSNIRADVQDSLGFTALMYAAEAEDIEIMQELLLQKNCGLNLQNVHGYSALMLAVNANKMYSVMLLLGCLQVDVNCQTIKGNSALIIAAAFGYTLIVMQLLARFDINVNHCNHHGKTALIYAVKRINNEVLCLLLDAPKINLRAKDHNGQNALSLAKLSDRQDMITRLEQKLSNSKYTRGNCSIV